MNLSIITINYNNCLGLEKTINSIISQTYKDFEYIVIDGDSTDGSKNIINKYKSHITTSISEPDSGIYNAMNKGVHYANREYCLFLNSGDVLAYPNVLENLAVMTSHEDIITGSTVFDDSEEVWISPEKVSLMTFLKGSLSHQSSLIKRSLLLKYPYDESKKIVSDWKFCIETLILHNCSYKRYEGIISKYDKTGISSNPSFFNKANYEKDLSLKELLPPRIIDDYKALLNGETKFEKLMVCISHNKQYANLIFNILYPITKLYCKIFHKSLLKGL